MRSALSRTAEMSGAAEREWHLVVRWPGLRGEPKLAWRTLWELAGRRTLERIIVTAAAVGEAQGTGERSGLRALEQLAVAGLVHVHGRDRGRWDVHLVEPAELTIGRRLAADPQRELFELEEEPSRPPPDELVAAGHASGCGAATRLRVAGERFGSLAVDAPAEGATAGGEAALIRGDDGREVGRRSAAEGATADVAQHPPRRNLGITSEKSASAQLKTSEFETSENFGDFSAEVSGKSQGGSCGGGSGATSAASVIGAVVDRVLDQTGRRGQRDAAVENYAAELRGQVTGLRAAPALRIATAVIEGRLKHDEVRGWLRSLRKAIAGGTLRETPWGYITGIAKKHVEGWP